MIEEKENKNEELEVVLEEPEKEKEVSVPSNPLDNLLQEEPSKEQEIDKTFENEREIKLEDKKVKEVPEYSEDMPYSLKVRKRIQKEVAKRAEAEQKLVEMEERMSKMEKKTYDIANKSLSNQLSSVSNQLKSAIEEGNTDQQVKLYENMAEIRSQMTKTEDYASQIPKTKEKTEKKAPPLATEWVKENSIWFNKPGYRKETAMAYGIDAELTEEGWDVHDPGYYDEMTKRLKSSGLSYFNKSEENTSKAEQNVVQKNNRVQSPVEEFLVKKEHQVIELSSRVMIWPLLKTLA